MELKNLTVPTNLAQVRSCDRMPFHVWHVHLVTVEARIYYEGPAYKAIIVTTAHAAGFGAQAEAEVQDLMSVFCTPRSFTAQAHVSCPAGSKP
jgi:hypothetical protein